MAIEGPKSVGKTTLIDQIQAMSPDTGDWLFTKEPTGQFDLGNEQRCVGAELAALIADDRGRHLAEVITPALERGQVVVTDRYILSSYVFHCLDGVSPTVVAGLNASFRSPDVLLILQCAPDTLRDRRAKQGHSTRLSTAITVEDEILAYTAYANACRPVSGEIIIGYNESMNDCHLIVNRLVGEIRTRKASYA
ncbi:thymidylate kinase [Herbihabitans rhizosphaerae]|uniref:Thymidylate kinase n=1 Tax=Herbihabitans rhizosphaerae TaxID=1872711 RepID=A0A4Q7L5B2_9PSEU|nr:thymidylate kinase [Herbihabitans rhizosphaerae]